jgi:hypothetical protein
VHRDLKPANLMLVSGPELTVKVIDFGLVRAAVLGNDEAALTQAGFVGTPAFASPEQFAGASVDTRSDLYSLGVTLWQMLTGQPPFQGSPTKLMDQHLHAPLPVERLEGLPQQTVALIKMLLDKDPARRFQSAAQVLQVIPTVAEAIGAPCAITPQGLQKVCTADPCAVASKLARRGPTKISVARLPITGNTLFGREEGLSFLDAAWASPQVNVATVIAWAGVGKSTLVNHWLQRMAAEHYRSAELVFGWSFATPGTCGQASSADDFLNAALSWFGDPDPRAGTAWEKGERLARLIAPHRTLLVLDGLEPIQHPSGAQQGRLREPSLQALLRGLTAFNRGLCVITTRLPVADMAGHEGTSARRCDLEQLSGEAGAQSCCEPLALKGWKPSCEAPVMSSRAIAWR